MGKDYEQHQGVFCIIMVVISLAFYRPYHPTINGTYSLPDVP